MQTRKLLFILMSVIGVVIVVGAIWKTSFKKTLFHTSNDTAVPASSSSAQLQVQVASPSASPVPSPTPMSFADMNAAYGPCAVVPTLMYHHIQPLDQAQVEGHKSLDVDAGWFQKQMQYLHDKNYSVLSMADLIAFFDNGSPMPKKSVLLTFDDAYDDFGTYAVPILQSFGYKSTLFVPTGLVENPGYLTWNTMRGIGSSVLFANHTWSHHSMRSTQEVDEKEIGTADKQLGDHGYNNPKVFAYPYGSSDPKAISYLQQLDYKVAFTTVHGSILCKKQRFSLPRVRIGNAQLNSYGL